MPKARIEAAFARNFKRVYICMKCNARLRSDSLRVRAKKVKCRKCGYRGLRPKSKEKKV